MRIHVEQRHIDAGKRLCGSHCPIALAIREATGINTGVAWGRAEMGGREIPLPAHAHSWYKRLDDGRPVKPFAFDLDWHPEPVAASGDSSPSPSPAAVIEPESNALKAQGPCLFWRPRIVREIEEMGGVMPPFGKDDIGAVKGGCHGG